MTDYAAQFPAQPRPREDRTLIDVNAAGAYNGHIPVTAINSIIGLIVADAKGLGPVVLSNERSSNVGNVEWMGQDINHQWSKSVTYETLLRDTLAASRARQQAPQTMGAAQALPR